MKPSRTGLHVFAAGDVTGRAMVVHEAARQGVVAGTNAVLGATTVLPAGVSPTGSFTNPVYASVGLTEAAARQAHEAAVATIRFDSLPRPIIDGRQAGFCKLVIDHQMPVEQLALVPFPSPHMQKPWAARPSSARSTWTPPEGGPLITSKQQFR